MAALLFVLFVHNIFLALHLNFSISEDAFLFYIESISDSSGYMFWGLGRLGVCIHRTAFLFTKVAHAKTKPEEYSYAKNSWSSPFPTV